MLSPQSSPGRELRGASRITGGIFRGRAQGNVFNIADIDDMHDESLGPVKGNVHLFISPADPASVKPGVLPTTMVFYRHVVPNLAPLLTGIGRLYDAIKGKIVLM